MGRGYVIGVFAVLAVSAGIYFLFPGVKIAQESGTGETPGIVSSAQTTIFHDHKDASISHYRPPKAQKIKFNFSLLLKTNPDLLKLNPQLDVQNLSANESEWEKLRLPKGTHLMALRDANCAPSSLQGIGQLSASKLEEASDQVRTPSMVSVTTSEEQSIADLGSSIAENSCVLGVFANGSLDDARVTVRTRDIASLLPPDTPNAPQVFEENSFSLAGKAALQDSIQSGGPNKVQIYVVGASVDAAGAQVDPTLALPMDGNQRAGEAAQFFVLSMPSGNAAEEIAALNNSILYAVASGARFVLVPYLNPSAILAASQYAAEHGAKVLMMPQGAAASEN